MISTRNTSLAHRMGTSAHLSPLLQKAHRLGLRDGRDLEKLAIERGLRYFGSPDQQDQGAPNQPAKIAENASSLTNEELAIALINPAAPYSLNRIRMAAAIIAGEGISASRILHLARMERCEAIVRHIAMSGAKVEPASPFWKFLLENLPECTPPNPDVLPHISRFVAMSGITRYGKQNFMQWIRPSA
jgi:hypothetical protein